MTELPLEDEISEAALAALDYGIFCLPHRASRVGAGDTAGRVFIDCIWHPLDGLKFGRIMVDLTKHLADEVKKGALNFLRRYRGISNKED